MGLATLHRDTEDLRKRLLAHPLYKKIESPKTLRIFMEHHVFAVWDFMSLLKALQMQLTSTNLPWTPIGNPNLRYLINEIVLAEETDVNYFNNRQSHYEMYLDAMKTSKANRNPITKFTRQIEHGTDIYLIIATSELPPSIKKFLTFTFDIALSNRVGSKGR